jgi:tRNA dimethylallyltransferase
LSATSSTDRALRDAPHVVVVAGPTATGKSQLAIKIAKELNGIIINADSQQRYGDLSILSARPVPDEMDGVPHKLFGDLGPGESGSAPEWAEKAAGEINCAMVAAQLPIIVGGTGLYLRALMDGLADIPSIPGDIRQFAEALLGEIGQEAFHARLKNCDPVTADRLAPGDTRRLLRAWEVAEATGTTLSEWHAAPASPPLRARYHSIMMMPGREELYDACDTRFQNMVENGAIEELRTFLRTSGSLEMPIMKMLGARELAAYLSDEVTLDTAVAAAQTATRRYAKRQVTWFSHQFHSDMIIDTKLSEILCARIFSNIRHLDGIEN